jgi:hypothetical protein
VRPGPGWRRANGAPAAAKGDTGATSFMSRCMELHGDGAWVIDSGSCGEDL